MSIRVNLDPLEAKTSFRYLAGTVMYSNSDWEVLYRNLKRD